MESILFLTGRRRPPVKYRFVILTGNTVYPTIEEVELLTSTGKNLSRLPNAKGFGSSVYSTGSSVYSLNGPLDGIKGPTDGTVEYNIHFWCPRAGNPPATNGSCFWGVEVPSDEVVTRIRMSAGGGPTLNRNPTSMRIEKSTDDTTWEVMRTLSQAQMPFVSNTFIDIYNQ